MILIDLLVRKQKQIFEKKFKVSKGCVKVETRAHSMQSCQEGWNSDIQVKWTDRLINQLAT